MTVVTTAMPARAGELPRTASGQSVLRLRPIERVAPLSHAFQVAASWVVRHSTVDGRPLVKVFPAENRQLHDAIVGFLQEVCSPNRNEYIIAFPIYADSHLGVVVRELELEGKLVWPECNGLSVTRRDRKVQVWLYQKNAPYGQSKPTLLYESLLSR